MQLDLVSGAGQGASLDARLAAAAFFACWHGTAAPTSVCQQPSIADLLHNSNFSQKRSRSPSSPRWQQQQQQWRQRRRLHASAPTAAALGVVEKLHENTAIVLPATGRKAFWEVRHARLRAHYRRCLLPRPTPCWRESSLGSQSPEARSWLPSASWLPCSDRPALTRCWNSGLMPVCWRPGRRQRCGLWVAVAVGLAESRPSTTGASRHCRLAHLLSNPLFRPRAFLFFCSSPLGLGAVPPPPGRLRLCQRGLIRLAARHDTATGRGHPVQDRGEGGGSVRVHAWHVDLRMCGGEGGDEHVCGCAFPPADPRRRDSRRQGGRAF